MSLYDEDEMECPFCGHVGLLPNGSFEFECPICGHDSYLEEDDETMEEDLRTGCLASCSAPTATRQIGIARTRL